MQKLITEGPGSFNGLRVENVTLKLKVNALTSEVLVLNVEVKDLTKQLLNAHVAESARMDMLLWCLHPNLALTQAMFLLILFFVVLLCFYAHELFVYYTWWLFKYFNHCNVIGTTYFLMNDFFLFRLLYVFILSFHSFKCSLNGHELTHLASSLTQFTIYIFNNAKRGKIIFLVAEECGAYDRGNKLKKIEEKVIFEHIS